MMQRTTFEKMSEKMKNSEPFDIFHTPIKRVSNASTVITPKPQVEIKNPFKQDLILTSLSFIPDAVFRNKGTALIKIGDNDFKVDSTSFTDTVSVTLPIPPNGIKFNRDMKIQIFVWNEVDGASVSLTLMAGLCGYIV